MSIIKQNRIVEIFIQYLTLGLISFGGPAAHIGYFHKVFVEQRQWLDDATYARLLSLSQILPGPGSSQMGFAIGLHRGGIVGACVAFLAFTFPSFVLMYLLAISNSWLNQNQWFDGVVTGLKLLAVVVVADATLKMFHKFCNRKVAIGIAVFTSALLLVSASLLNQIFVLVFAAIMGIVFFNAETDTPQQLNNQNNQNNQGNQGNQNNNQNDVDTNSHAKIKTSGNQHQKSNVGWGTLSLFFVLFVVLSVVSSSNEWLSLFTQFYQAGSLVFGGGHVVLPLLQELIFNSTSGEAMSHDRFLMGYAAAQAVPGPMFALASFLGAELSPSNQLIGALVASAGVFLPGFLLVIALHKAWADITRLPKIAGAIWGINAAVVGLLMTALFNPVFTSAIIHADFSHIRMAIVIICFFALQQLEIKIIWLVVVFSVIGILLKV